MRNASLIALLVALFAGIAAIDAASALAATGLSGDSGATYLSLSTSTTEALRITATQSVGIGTASPQATLDVNGPAKFGADATTCSGSITGRIRWNSGSTRYEFCDGSAWSPFNSCPSPAICPNVGDVCDDGNAGNDPDPQFAGCKCYYDSNSADYGKCKALYITQSNQSTGSQWKTSTGTNDIATDSTEDGKVNDGQVPNSTTFPAFKLCKDLTYGGYTGWYIPSLEELRDLLYRNQSAIGGFSSAYYWASTESTISNSYSVYLVSGVVQIAFKTNSSYVRCVRRD